MSAAQVSASGGAHADMPLRPPPQEFQQQQQQQQQRSREEIELAESLLDHRHGPRDTTRHFSQEQQSQQMMQHQTPQQHQAPQQQLQQQSHYQTSHFSAHDDRRATQSADPPRSQQGAEFTPSNHQSPYPMHPHPSAQQHQQSSPRASTPSSQNAATSSNGQYCSNCGTTKTPLWRRSQLGQTICNACGLYEKARNTARPPNLKRPPSYAPAYSSGPGSDEQDPSNSAATNTYVSAQSQPCQGTCPGDGKCNGTGGTAACHGCPAFNNRVSKTAQLALHHTRRTSPSGDSVTAGSIPHDSAPGPDIENVVIACQNCHTTTTPLWRRDMDGHTICNACGLYYKLHGSHRPVEMKKSFIKRRKRVAPALAGQDVQHVSNSAASASEMSTSPEAPAAHVHHGHQHDAWSQRSHARNPVEAQPNIDPTLARSHGPPPVDFTAYNSKPPRPIHPSHQPTQTGHHYENASHAPPSPISPKRRHQTLSVQEQLAPHTPHQETTTAEPASGNVRSEPAATPSTAGDGDNGDNDDDDDARRKKRMKREQLKEKLRKMQEEIQALGDSDDDA